MKVSERTTNLLKNYANINQSIEFREGKILKTVSPLNTILTSVEIELLDLEKKCSFLVEFETWNCFHNNDILPNVYHQQ